MHRSEYLGWDNPFVPSGKISQDADLMVRCWKENSLAMLYEEESPEKEEIRVKQETEDQEEALRRDVMEHVVEENNGIDSSSLRPEPEKFDHLKDFEVILELDGGNPEKKQARCCLLS